MTTVELRLRPKEPLVDVPRVGPRVGLDARRSEDPFEVAYEAAVNLVEKRPLRLPRVPEVMRPWQPQVVAVAE